MLSNTSRRLTYLLAVMYAILGAALFLFPEQLAPVFAWKVTAFMTMTIGGWCLGNGWLAWFAARRWKWELVEHALIYLWAFGWLEILVVIGFVDKLQLAHPIAWLYLITLGLNGVIAILGIIDWLRIRPHSTEEMPPVPTRVVRVLLVLFILLVGFLGAYGLLARIGDPGTQGTIFPEVMSLFTLRSFGAFYLSLTIGVIPLLWAMNRRSFLSHGFLSYGLLIFITAAAIIYLRLFNFSAHPLQILYIAAYVAVGIVIGFFLLREGTGLRQQP